MEGVASAVSRRGATQVGEQSIFNLAETEAASAISTPNRIFSARVLRRSAEESGPYHNFPSSFDDQIFTQGTRTVTRNFWRTDRQALSNDSINV